MIEGRFVIIVLDGFGVGEMPDVGQVRPQDKGADTCRHVFERNSGLYLPTLEKLGLVNITGSISPLMREAPEAIFGKAMLMHDGADTFFGHQEIMGTLPQKTTGEPFRNKINNVKKLLCDNGFLMREHTTGGETLLIVDDCVTVADNIECDPGQAVNVTAVIDKVEFDRVLRIGKLVRSVTAVPRVIAFGGRGVGLSDLLSAVEVRGEYIGVNAPASGVYNNDYHCVHMGYGVDPETQVPTILGRAGVPVFLLGKAADVVSNKFGKSIAMVDTSAVLGETQQLLKDNHTGFFCTNVQETDLCGHRQNTKEYANKLKEADRGIEAILEVLTPEDILIVMADHGNDPDIGHPRHTREMAPLMVHSARPRPGSVDLGVRTTLSDVGATAAHYFGAKAPQNGRSFLAQITNIKSSVDFDDLSAIIVT